MGYTRNCEPLRVWNRLEPRARKKDFSRVLKAEVHDALWFLARQWQFGEFKGEDTGSAILAKLATRSAKMTSFQNNDGVHQMQPDEMPLETRVERTSPPQDWNFKIQLGRQWLKIIDTHGHAFNESGGTPAYDANTYKALFHEHFVLQMPDLNATDPAGIADRARMESNTRLRQYLNAMSGRVIDGSAVLAALPENTITWPALPARLAYDIPEAHRDFYLAALETFRDWYRGVWSQPDNPDDSAWNEAQLEYQFACRIPRPEGDTLVLKAEDYASCHLDWYSFELGQRIPAGASSDENTEKVVQKVFSVIPTPAEFPGQPNARYWELEDGAVDLGNIRADSTDLAKIIVAEFALVYGNNWFVIPCRQEVGTLTEIEGIVVDDVFGQRTFVAPATSLSDNAWTCWDMFSLDGHPDISPLNLGMHLFIPANMHSADKSEMVESVRLIRDEMANTVWAVESRIPDGMGGGKDGHDAARRFRDTIERYEPQIEQPVPSEDAPRLRYILGNTVPENWIPFLPVHKPRDNRAIRLQRAAMPRFFQDTVRPVRPVTSILRPGLADNNSQITPYFIHEEEVPRSGVSVDAGFRRTRWYNGKTFVWYGLSKYTGRGEGSSGLRFDVLKDEKQGV